MVPPVRRRIPSLESFSWALNWWVGVGFLVILFSYPFYLIVFEFSGGDSSETYFTLIVIVLFLAIGFRIIPKAVVGTLGYLRYRQLSLGLQGELPRLGGTLTAVFVLPAGVSEAERVRAELVLTRTYWTAPFANGAKRVTDRYWSEQHAFPVVRSGLDAYAEIRINIPSGLPSSFDSRSPTEVFTWYLRVEAKTPRSSVSRIFPIEMPPSLREAQAS